MHHEYLRCPVTALAFLSNGILLAGQGNHLQLYQDVDPDTHIQSIKVFDDQAIHGIVVADHARLVLIWGGRLIRLASLSGNGIQLRLSSPEDTLIADDWILDAAFAVETEGQRTQAALVTAHNALYTIQTHNLLAANDQDTGHAVLQRTVSGSNCILYSAHVKWLSASHCLVASGTAFGDVVLWSSFFSPGSTRSETHFTFSAHEGSVFGVQVSSSLRLPGSNQDKRVLATCSDDRTVRLWDVSDLSLQSPDLTQLLRDTGFGSRSKEEAHAPPLLAKVMGHSSRIWHVRFLHDFVAQDGVQPQLLSCGEDTFVKTWILERNYSGLPYVLQQTDTESAHSGKNIWSITQHPSGIIVTGGADGAIARYSELSGRGIITEIDRNMLREQNGSSADNYKAYTFISKDTLISTTEHGRIVLLDITNDVSRGLELSPPILGLRGYSVTASSGDKAFVSGTDGAIYVYDHAKTDPRSTKLSKMAQRSGKTAGLFTARLSPNEPCLLATSVTAEVASVYIVRRSAAEGTDAHAQEHQLMMPHGAVVTSFSVCGKGDVVHIFLGMRSGSIVLYTITGNACPGAIHSTCTKELVHGSEGVTGLITQQRRSERGQPQTTYLVSTGRDGTLAVHRVASDSARPSLTLVHQLSLPFGPNVEGIYFSPILRTLSAYGFRGKHFVLYDTCTQQETLSVECGGAHRSWVFQPHHAHAGGTFVWTKASRVYRFSQRTRPCRTINSGGHGREIKAVAVSQKFETGREIIATGAEDTDIKLFHLSSEGDGGFKCLQTLRKHNTGIQHLAWDGEHLFSSGGFEEFFIWKVSHDTPCFDVGVLCEKQHPRSGKSDLRICGFDVQRLSAQEAVGFEISMAYSDSSLKLWRYRGGRWDLLAAGNYLTSCLTHVLRQGSGKGDILTATTDGHITLWPFNEKASASLSWTARYKLHQSALHALVSARLADDSVLLASGGDDNAIALSRLTPHGTLRTLLIPRAHTAAVIGLVLVRLHEDAFCLASASLDQRIRLWRIDADATREGVDGVEVKRVSDVFTSVADVCALEMCTLPDGVEGLLVCGVGMDVWRLPEVQ